MIPNRYGIEAVKCEWRGPWEEPILRYNAINYLEDIILATESEN